MISFNQVWHKTIDDHVLVLDWSPDGQTLAAASVSGPATLFHLDGTPRFMLPAHGFGTMSLRFQPCAGSSLLATSGQDGKIRLWDSSTGERVREMDGGAAWVEQLDWSGDGAYLASSAGRKIRLWTPEGDMLNTYDHPRSTVSSLGWRPKRGDNATSHLLAVTGYGGLNLYSPSESACKEEIRWKGSSLVVAWSPDGRFIATGDQDSTIHLWFAETGQNLQLWGYSAKVTQLAWDISSRYLATGGSESVVVWDCSGKGPEGTRPVVLQGHRGLISCIAFQPTGDILASGGRDGNLKLWRGMKTKNSPLHTAELGATISQLAWSPHGKYLAAGTESGDVFLFEV
jgi:WD40 repeat protein